MTHWPWIHAVLWANAAGMVYCAILAERNWKDGPFAKFRVWWVRWCVAGALWMVYTAGAVVPR